ncbi:GmrSD restriction endonuclease domain-containing protein [Youngiibacter multivorans]|uniref:GmrSD restriction endonucleases N-terminal domain-containing protein n=1 Tax=Youngiibacter multivorans TaxID=937251 RepID=A0ABS4G0W0_9CLOT|nr:DUF262 domain-containing protein [Youngiibacter multivorans]MBP1918188.1 hypothetical protein [Youngiibacter multivorans]
MAKAIYTNVPRQLSDILKDVRNGRIGLPDLQRPFVWKDNKVRDLYDSMLKGFPIGYIMLWESPVDYDDKKAAIGIGEKAYKVPKDLVIDGQQRLTALVASMYGETVKDKNFQDRRIRIGYKPQTKEFDVWTQAVENNPEYISDISEAFSAKENNTSGKFRKDFIRRLNESRIKRNELELSDEEEYQIEENINELLHLESYQIPSLEIAYSSSEEDVADIFVRVNSAGQKLTENDFILTLISVYEKDRRDQIDKFCADSRIPADKTSFNHLLSVDPSHLVRMTVGVGFRRARLRYAYMILRGKDLQSGITSEEIRESNLEIFKKALDKVVDLNNWHGYLNILKEAGYISDKLIASSNAVVFSYVLYLIAKYDYHMDSMRLRKLIRKWFFMAAITYFYTGNAESDVEKQFADMREFKTADELEAYLQRAIDARFTEDYFKITLPMELETSSAISPSWYGYLASQIVLGYPMLFSTTPLSHMFSAGASGTKNAVDKHHIFPKNYLAQIGIEKDRDRNQTGNFTYLDYNTNIHVSDRRPQEYVVAFREKLGDEEYFKTCSQHALPDNFEAMDYFEFIQKRRFLMAQIVKKAYQRLCNS